MISIIFHSEKGKKLADKLLQNDVEAELITKPVDYEKLWKTGNALVFIGALGICVREIAPFLKNKKTDPAVINIDANGQFVQPVVFGSRWRGERAGKETVRFDRRGPGDYNGQRYFRTVAAGHSAPKV